MKPYRIIAAGTVLFLFFLNAGSLFSETVRREWTSNGVAAIGAWDPSWDTTEDRITLESSDGSQRTLSLKDLSENDRAYVEAKRKETGWEPMPDPGAQHIYALLVGVNDYKKYQDLNYAVRDIELLREQLLKMRVPSGNIRMLCSGGSYESLPTKENIEEELDRLLGVPADSERGSSASEPLVKKGDLVFIALSGHGTQTPNGAYFMPADASEDKGRLESSSISIDALQERISESEATFKWLVVDACRSDPPTLAEHIGERNSADFSLMKLQTILDPPPGMIVMQSCSPNESSYESESVQQGIFTSTLVEGLQGQADMNGDGSVTITELCGYVSDATHRKVWEERHQTQTPRISNALSDFVVIDGLLSDGVSLEDWDRAGQLYEEACALRRQRKYSEAKDRISESLRIVEASSETNQNRLKFQDEKDRIDQFLSLRTENPPLLPGKSEESEPVRVTHLDRGTKPGEKKTLAVKGVDYTFCWCPAGEFTMGSPKSEEGREDEEKPHRVRLARGFWLLETEVTQEMWESVMGKSKRIELSSNFGKGNRYPVYNVNWNDAAEFCSRLSKLAGQNAVLPTEAQWEYACRAGSTGPYGGTGDLDSMGWYADNSNNQSREVKRKEPNIWGLYDMHGNVQEWCADKYHPKYYDESPADDPIDTSAGSERALRGGSWILEAEYCRSGYRSGLDSARKYNFLGFRPAVIPSD